MPCKCLESIWTSKWLWLLKSSLRINSYHLFPEPSVSTSRASDLQVGCWPILFLQQQRKVLFWNTEAGGCREASSSAPCCQLSVPETHSPWADSSFTSGGNNGWDRLPAAQLSLPFPLSLCVLAVRKTGARVCLILMGLWQEPDWENLNTKHRAEEGEAWHPAFSSKPEISAPPLLGSWKGVLSQWLEQGKD